MKPSQWRGGWIGLVGFILLCLLVGSLGAHFTAESVTTWYPTLIKPSWTPPPAIFPPVWSTLYVLMGVAGWLVWRKHGFAGARAALALFAVQLVLNAAWSYWFFARRSPGAALIDLGLLWVLIGICVFVFRRKQPVAGFLLIPYWLWVSYAGALNFAIWQLNPKP